MHCNFIPSKNLSSNRFYSKSLFYWETVPSSVSQRTKKQLKRNKIDFSILNGTSCTCLQFYYWKKLLINIWQFQTFIFQSRVLKHCDSIILQLNRYNLEWLEHCCAICNSSLTFLSIPRRGLKCIELKFAEYDADNKTTGRKSRVGTMLEEGCGDIHSMLLICPLLSPIRNNSKQTAVPTTPTLY